MRRFRKVYMIVLVMALVGTVAMLATLASQQAEAESDTFVFNGHTYQAIAVPSRIDWDTAKAAAESLSLGACQGHLATITSQEENDFIAQNFPLAVNVPPGAPGFRPFYLWGGFQHLSTGPTDPGHVPGGADISDGVLPGSAAGWAWVTGEPFVFTNWADGSPSVVPIFQPSPAALVS